MTSTEMDVVRDVNASSASETATARKIPTTPAQEFMPEGGLFQMDSFDIARKQ